MLPGSRVSTAMAVACPPASLISRSTVLIVDCGEFGAGGNGFVAYASEVDFAATTTGGHCQGLPGSIERECVPVYPFFARSIATCLPMPREAPTTNAILFFLAIIVD
jgi:hypothetical protein